MATKPFFLIGCLLLVLLMVGTVSADTLTIYPTIDGRIYLTGKNEVYSALRNETTGQGVNTDDANRWGPGTQSSTTLDQFAQIAVYAASYNTTVIPANATITSSLISMKTRAAGNVNLGTPQFVFTGGSLISPNALAVGDLDGWTQSEYTTRATYPNTTSTRTNYTLNANGISYIEQSGEGDGYTIFFGRDTWHVDNLFGGTWASAMNTVTYFYFVASAGTDNDPYLYVEYTLPDITPPASITGLTNDTPTCSSINWSWTNPVDADYNGTMIYNNNVFVHNGTAGSTQSWWGSLSASTSYTFSSRTFDNATPANVNTTWVNATATTTSSCGSAPVSSFTIQKSLYRIPGILQANDTSTNTPTLWNWSWGDGTWTNGTTQNATHKYTTRGLKSILLVTSNANGANTTPTASTVRIVGYENYG